MRFRFFFPLVIMLRIFGKNMIRQAANCCSLILP